MRITVVSTMRNEAPHVLEWVAHHLAAGVTDFLIYTNDCDDGTDALLSMLPAVTHVPLPDGVKPPQWRALKAAWDHPVVVSSDWICCMDCDEFINLSNGLSSVGDLVSEANFDAMILPWRLFGHNGQIAAQDGLTIDRFTRAAPEDMLYPALGSYFKTLFRREGPFRQLGVHRPKQKNKERHGVPVWVDGSGQAVAPGLAENDGRIMNWGSNIARDLVQMNHYSLRSVEEFMSKRARGLPNHREKNIDLTYWVERNFNQVEDKSISRMQPATLAKYQELLAIAGVRAAYEAGILWHKKAFQQMLQDPEHLNLYGRLILAGGSSAPDASNAMSLVKAYQIANR